MWRLTHRSIKGIWEYKSRGVYEAKIVIYIVLRTGAYYKRYLIFFNA